MANVQIVAELERLQVAHLSDVNARATAAQGAKADAALPAAEVGQSVASLVGGKVPAGQLPSFVDDVLEFANLAAFPASGESGKIYLAINGGDNPSNPTKQYRWTGTAYMHIPASPGTTDDVPEGANNKYFSAVLARAVTLGSLALTNAAILAGDTFEVMFGKLQAQINALKSAQTCIPIACSDETTALTAGAAKVTFRMPFAMTNVSVRASLTVPQTSGALLTIDVKEGGVSLFSTKPTFDNAEKSTTTALAPAQMTDTTLADDAEITIDISQIGDGTAKGLKVYILGNK
ncbi:hypothetical protein [Pseudomonas turukhanskensis]|uniref:Tail fiber protein n=1 Tax=Pseudomonas turukhanskensis TaxID=1806536 RepID=A0A9W6K7F5_9PSED|nr:hypothetical protein [Pseudomonas turukhanskensis]GLK88328.1 hypothetical protein GCM10017655_13900 [Pseudomonas turukhanskensis]